MYHSLNLFLLATFSKPFSELCHSHKLRFSCVKQLPITEFEEEKAKGSFYFKVLGKEVMYNYFTYDDVRELIEDGVIRVNNDLKDMLKKGMKC